MILDPRTRIALPIAFVLACGAASAQCGECDAVPGSTITDALAAAQHGVGLIVIDAMLVDSCDVNSIGGIDVIDALWIAKRAVGLTQAFDCVAEPNQAPAVSCLFPTGAEMLGGQVELTLNLNVADANGDLVDLEVMYSIDWGFSWHPCTWTPASGTGLGVSAPPGGAPIDLVWDLVADMGSSPTPIIDTRLTINVSDGVAQGTPEMIDYFYLQIP